VQGKEVLEVVEREEEVRNPGGLGGVLVGAATIVTVVEIKVGPNVDGGRSLVVPAGFVESIYDLSEGARFGSRIHRANELKRRLESF
jgi:hypothetical protein